MLTCAAGNYVKASERVNGMYYVPKDIKERIVRWIDDRLVIFNNDYTAEWETMREKIEDIASQGYRLIVLDNLFALDLGDDDSNQNNKQKRFILNLCQIAKDKRVFLGPSRLYVETIPLVPRTQNFGTTRRNASREKGVLSWAAK